MYLTHEHSADGGTEIIPYKVVNRILATLYGIIAGGFLPTICELWILDSDTVTQQITVRCWKYTAGMKFMTREV